jgi:hypothetical protein
MVVVAVPYISSPGKELGDDVKELAAGVLFRCDHATCLQAFEGRGGKVGRNVDEVDNFEFYEPERLMLEQLKNTPLGKFRRLGDALFARAGHLCTDRPTRCFCLALDVQRLFGSLEIFPHRCQLAVTSGSPPFAQISS